LTPALFVPELPRIVIQAKFAERLFPDVGGIAHSGPVRRVRTGGELEAIVGYYKRLVHAQERACSRETWGIGPGPRDRGPER
jgi:hypothetical protein